MSRSNSWSLGIVLSVLVHVGVVAGGLALTVRAPARNNVELVDVGIQEIKDFPLGAPSSSDGDKPHAQVPPTNRAPKVAAPTGTIAARAGDEKSSSESPKKDEARAARSSALGAHGSEGSALTVLMRLDRLRGTEYQSAVDQLLLHVSDRRDLLQGTGLELFADFDTLLVATPDPKDPSVTFLAARYHIDEPAMRAALTRGAESTEHSLVWREEGKRLVGEWRALEDGGSAQAGSWDDRIVVLSDPGLAVVAPSAYRALLIGSPAAGPVASRDGGVSVADPEVKADADAEVKADADADGKADGSVPDADTEAKADGGAPAPEEWASLRRRIEAEEEMMPPNGVVTWKAIDLLRAAGSSVGDDAVLKAMETPLVVRGTIGIDDAPFLDAAVEFKTEASARQWETQWPTLQRRLSEHSFANAIGLSSLVGRATLGRDGNVVRLHLAVTPRETVWLLGLAVQRMASGT